MMEILIFFFSFIIGFLLIIGGIALVSRYVSNVWDVDTRPEHIHNWKKWEIYREQIVDRSNVFLYECDRQYRICKSCGYRESRDISNA